MKKQKQSFVVLGLGRFGSSVARSLCELGHEVLAVDRDEKLVENIAPDVTQAVQANAVDEDALAELGVQNFDAAIVAIGTDIRASILATVLLKEAGVPKVLAKAVDDLHARVAKGPGDDFGSPVMAVEADFREKHTNGLWHRQFLPHLLSEF